MQILEQQRNIWSSSSELELFDQGFYAAKGWMLPNPEYENNREYMDGWWQGAYEQMNDSQPYCDI